MMANEACNRFGTNYCTGGRRHSVHIVNNNLTIGNSNQDSDKIWYRLSLRNYFGSKIFDTLSGRE